MHVAESVSKVVWGRAHEMPHLGLACHKGYQGFLHCPRFGNPMSVYAKKAHSPLGLQVASYAYFRSRAQQADDKVAAQRFSLFAEQLQVLGHSWLDRPQYTTRVSAAK